MVAESRFAELKRPHTGKLTNVIFLLITAETGFTLVIFLFVQGRSRAQNLAPVTVAQILNASNSEDRFFTGALEISQVMYLSVLPVIILHIYVYYY